jgi:hypothetical protein
MHYTEHNEPISDRLVFDGWNIALEFKPQDLWIGAYWKRIGHCVDVWICLVPMLPIHVSWWWHDPLQ